VGPNIKIRGDATDGYVRNVTYEDLVISKASKNNLIIHTDYDILGRGAAGGSNTTNDGE
jgi:hypothetical protein